MRPRTSSLDASMSLIMRIAAEQMTCAVFFGWLHAAGSPDTA